MLPQQLDSKVMAPLRIDSDLNATSLEAAHVAHPCSSRISP